MAEVDVADLPDPDDRTLAWSGDEPAFMAWWSRGEELGRGPEGALSFVLSHQLFSRYAYAIPTSDALDTLLQLGPLLELGAGGGYWARLLRDRGGDVIATDPDPTPGNGWIAGSGLWTHVDRAGLNAIAAHPRRALFVCWPKRPRGFMHDILERAPERVIALITNGLPCESDDLLERLQEDWTMVEEVELPTTPIVYRGDSLTVWTPR